MTVPLAPEAAALQPMQAPVMPWTPFKRLPTDTEPENAKLRRIRLARLIDSAKFESYPPEWQQVAIMEYEEMRGVEAAAAQPAPDPNQKPQPGAKKDGQPPTS